MPPAAASPGRWLYAESGLGALYASPRDTKLLCLQRFVRLFAYGASSLIIALHLEALGVRTELIGLFMTLTLVGDVFISLLLTLCADALGRRNVLVVGALLMCGSGAVFATADSYWLLLAAAVLGVVSPSGNEIGPFRAVEESTLAQMSHKDSRSDIFAWYTLLGTAGAALGQISFGWVIERLTKAGWPVVRAYRVTFVAYAVLGLVKLVLALALSSAVEHPRTPPPPPPSTSGEHEDDDPTRPLLDPAPVTDASTTTAAVDTAAETAPPAATSGGQRPTGRALLPAISRESRAIVAKIALLFAVDSFASGLVPVSWVVVFFTDKFAIPIGTLGTIVFATSLVAALSNVFAAALARRIGLIRTMVFTHLPSSIFLALIPAPTAQWPAVAFLALRACTATMDTAPRQAFLAAAVLDAERTAVMGFLNVVRTSSQSIGPFVTGGLRATDAFWVAFVLAGALKAAYDLGMLVLFVGFKARD